MTQNYEFVDPSTGDANSELAPPPEPASDRIRRSHRLPASHAAPESVMRNLLTKSFASNSCCITGTCDEEAMEPNSSDNSDDDGSASASGSDEDDACWEVQAEATAVADTEQDRIEECCKDLSRHLRERPTLPANSWDPNVSFKDVDQAVRLPLFSCPFKGCIFNTDQRLEFLRHVGHQTGPHYKTITDKCKKFFEIGKPLDFVYQAMALKERDQIPCIGMATTRRALRTLTTVFNDKTIKSLSCFVCARIFTTLSGPSGIVHDKDDIVRPRTDIEFVTKEWLQETERQNPGTLLNNCSFELWHKGYVHGEYDEASEKAYKTRALANRIPSADKSINDPYAPSEWCAALELGDSSKLSVLFGVTEDVCCNDPSNSAQHEQECATSPFCRRLCQWCQIPICKECMEGLHNFKASSKIGSIPMAIANDNY